MKINSVSNLIHENGGSLYLVGGCVRDRILKLSPKDNDYCVVGLTEQLFCSLFPKAVKVGSNFPVYLMTVGGVSCEFALARVDKKVATGHKGFDVVCTPDLSIEQDLLRRDITINAMAINVQSGVLVDPYGGSKDAENRIIRHVSEHFKDDPLRVYRVARFSAKLGNLGFKIDKETLNLMRSLKNELYSLPKERVVTELKKVFETTKPSLFFRALRDSNTLDVHFDPIDRMIGVPQQPKYHPEGDVFEHTMQSIDSVVSLSSRPEVIFSTLLHDIGKIVTPLDLLPKHHGHEISGVVLVKAYCSILGTPNSWRDSAMVASRYHQNVHNLFDMRPSGVIDLLHVLSSSKLGIEGISDVAISDSRGRNDYTVFEPQAASLKFIWECVKSNVNGDILDPTIPRDINF